MIENINTILIYIFFILLLFCIMYLFIYSDQKISFYDNLDSIENSIKNDMYKDKHQDNKQNTNVYNKEKFESIRINKTIYTILNPPESSRTVSDVIEYRNDTPAEEKSSILDSPGGWLSADTNLGPPNIKFLQMDLGSVIKVVGVVTQCHKGVTQKQCVTSYKVQYSIDNIIWTIVDKGKVFSGNSISNTNEKISNLFSKSIAARYIRIIPETYNIWIAMRAGVLIDSVVNTSLPTLPSIYSNIDGEAYYQALSDFNNYIVDTRNNLGSIITTINNAEFKTAANNKLLTDNIKHLYFKEYLQYTNKVNANVYNESNDYLNPKKKKTQ